jgi:hypothetical protein
MKAKYSCIGWSMKKGCEHKWTRDELYSGQDRAKCPMCGNDYVQLLNAEAFELAETISST